VKRERERERERKRTDQMLNPPSALPGVLSQTSWRTSVHWPVLNVQLPRPMLMPYTELQ